MTGQQIFDAIARGDGVNIEDSTGRWIYATSANPEAWEVQGWNQYGDRRIRCVKPDDEYATAFVPDFSGYTRIEQGDLTIYTKDK